MDCFEYYEKLTRLKELNNAKKTGFFCDLMNNELHDLEKEIYDFEYFYYDTIIKDLIVGIHSCLSIEGIIKDFENAHREEDVMDYFSELKNNYIDTIIDLCNTSSKLYFKNKIQEEYGDRIDYTEANGHVNICVAISYFGEEYLFDEVINEKTASNSKTHKLK